MCLNQSVRVLAVPALSLLVMCAGLSASSGCSGEAEQLAPTLTSPEDIKAHHDKMLKRAYGDPAADAPQSKKKRR